MRVALLLALLASVLALAWAVPHTTHSLDSHAGIKETGLRIYVTFHGGAGKKDVNTAYSYDLQGRLLSNNVLQGEPNARSLRSMLIQADGTLLVCNAYKEDSRIGLFSSCNPDGSRTFLGDFASTHLAHPYGLAGGMDYGRRERVVWASNQNTNDIVQFTEAGAVFQKQVRSFGSEQLRSLAYDPNTGFLYVANRDANAVLAYDTRIDAWDRSQSFNVSTPVGLYLDATHGRLFIGSNGSPSSVYAYDLRTGALLQRFRDVGMQHPAGILALNNTVWVLSQDAGTLQTFALDTGKLTGTPVARFPDKVEQLLFSPC